jgi:hypothetical protein
VVRKTSRPDVAGDRAQAQEVKVVARTHKTLIWECTPPPGAQACRRRNIAGKAAQRYQQIVVLALKLIISSPLKLTVLMGRTPSGAEALR